MKILAFIEFKCGFYRNQPGGMKQIIWIPFKKGFRWFCERDNIFVSLKNVF